VVAVSAPLPLSNGHAPTQEQAARLARWSWAMAGLFFVAIAATGMLGYAVTSWFGLPDGALLTEAGGRGWLATAGLLAVQLAPVAVGSALGARAVRLGGGASAGSALAVNVLLGIYAVVVEAFGLFVG
jgi:hypothetical protein